MSSSQTSYDPSDLEKLNDQDKDDLRQFLAKEQQRSQIQSQTHVLANICWKKCITGSIKKSSLDSSEETCISNCVDRFLDLNFLTIKHLNNMRGS